MILQITTDSPSDKTCISGLGGMVFKSCSD